MDDSGSGQDLDTHKPYTWLQTMAAVMAAFFGVRSSKNARRDAAQGKASHYIIAGFILTALFVLSLVVLVNLLIKYHA